MGLFLNVACDCSTHSYHTQFKAKTMCISFILGNVMLLLSIACRKMLLIATDGGCRYSQFWGQILVDARSHILDGVPDLPREWALFRGTRAIGKYFKA